MSVVRCITPGAPMIVPKCLRGDGIVGWSGTFATVAGRNFGSEVYSRIWRAYSGSEACARTAGEIVRRRAAALAIEAGVFMGTLGGNSRNLRLKRTTRTSIL